MRSRSWRIFCRRNFSDIHAAGLGRPHRAASGDLCDGSLFYHSLQMFDPSLSPHPALGIDHGDVRIGVAATDDFGILAHPVETIDQSKGGSIERIAQLAELRKIRTIVVGLPLRMDGSEGSSAAKVRAFSDQLRERLPSIPLVFVDETLTTSSAAGKLREAGKNARQQKAIIDQAAAVEILNLWMGGGECGVSSDQ